MEILSDPAVIWMICGIVGLVLELIVPGLIIVFFGIGALTTAFALLGLDLSLSKQLTIFFATSGVSLILFRKSLKKKFFDSTHDNKSELDDEFLEKQATALIDFKQNQGKIEFKGTSWKAISTEKIIKGQLVKIISKDSITLTVKPI